jgi:hypothetical protein
MGKSTVTLSKPRKSREWLPPNTIHTASRDLSCQHLGHEDLHPFTMYISMLKPSFWSRRGVDPSAWASSSSLQGLKSPSPDGRWRNQTGCGWETLASTIKYQKVSANSLVMQFVHEWDGYDWGSHQQKPPEKITSLPEPSHLIFWYRNWMCFSQPNESINKHHHGTHEELWSQ